MKKAIKEGEHIIVLDDFPIRWKGKSDISENDYYNFGFKDFIEPPLLDGQVYGELYEDLVEDNFSIEVVVYPTFTDLQKLGEKIQDPITKVFTYTVLDKSAEDVANEIFAIESALQIAKGLLIIKFESDTDSLIKEIVGERAFEYQLAETEAIAFKAAGYPDNDVPASVSSDAIANNYSNTIACDLILTMATNWRGVQTALRANRLMSKAQVKNAITEEELQTTESNWNFFLEGIRQQIVG